MASSPARRQTRHVMTVDVEDYFMVEAFAGSVERNSWAQRSSRVVANTQRILELFGRYGVKATFFFVGWIAEKFPELVREVQEQGHEIGCHSYWHRTVYSLTPEEFRADTRAAVEAIESAAGVKVEGYRAPSWSITRDCRWALDVLAEEGFTYDSSIYPIVHDLYGVPGARRFPYEIRCGNGRVLREYPPATIRLLGQNLPGAGGGYLRILPLSYTRWVFRVFERSYGEKVVVYIHPWEVDPDQPRIPEKLRSRMRHYTGLEKTAGKLEFLLSRYEFGPMSEGFAEVKLDSVVTANSSEITA